MNPSAVLLVVRLEELSVLEIAVAATIAIEALAKCIPSPVANAKPRQKSRFSLAAIDRYFAGIAIPSPNNFPINKL
jgi:hypothetical protein